MLCTCRIYHGTTIPWFSLFSRIDNRSQRPYNSEKKGAMHVFEEKASRDTFEPFASLAGGSDPVEKASSSDQIRIKKLEEDVAFLKVVIRYMLTDIDKLKKAQ